MDIIQEVKKLNFPLGQYVVFGSGPLAVHGIRDTRDVDIAVAEKLYNDLEKSGKWQKKVLNDGTIYLVQGIYEIGPDWNYGEQYNPDIDDLINRAEIIDDIPFAPLEDVLKWKKAFGRPKDIDDVKLIENYLRKSNKG